MSQIQGARGGPTEPYLRRYGEGVADEGQRRRWPFFLQASSPILVRFRLLCHLLLQRLFERLFAIFFDGAQPLLGLRFAHLVGRFIRLCGGLGRVGIGLFSGFCFLFLWIIIFGLRWLGLRWVVLTIFLRL